ncbi:hypothetical protein D3C71_925890 [compost metagenome]
MAVVQAPGQQQGLVEELPDFSNQREWTPGPGMPASSRGDGDQTIHASFGGLLGMAASRHVMEHQASVAVHCVDQFLHCAEAGDHDRHFVLDANLQVSLQPWIAVVDDQVYRVRRGVFQRRQPGLDLFQPGLEPAALALVQGRKTAHHAIAAAGEHQLRIGNQEHRRRHHGQTQTLFEQSGQRHWKYPDELCFLELERSNDDQNYDCQQYQNRHFIEPAKKDMAAGVLATGKTFHLCAAHVVVADQQHDQGQFGVYPATLAEDAWIEVDEPAAEDQRGDHRRAHDAPVQLALHDAEAFLTDRVFTLCVVNEQARQVEQAGKPAHNADDVKSFEP